MSLNVITVSTALALGLAAALLAVDLIAWRIVAAMFDRERLVTSTRGRSSLPRCRPPPGTQGEHDSEQGEHHSEQEEDQQCPQR